MSSISKNKSLKAALALGGGLVTVGLMAAMMNDDDGPPEDVVDGVQSTMTGLVDKAGGAVAAMAASVGDAVKASLGGVLKSSAPPAAKKAKKKKTAKTKAASKAKKARKAAKAKGLAAAAAESLQHQAQLAATVMASGPNTDRMRRVVVIALLGTGSFESPA